jgi:hypothetical protein
MIKQINGIDSAAILEHAGEISDRAIRTESVISWATTVCRYLRITRIIMDLPKYQTFDEMYLFVNLAQILTNQSFGRSGPASKNRGSKPVYPDQAIIIEC